MKWPEYPEDRPPTPGETAEIEKVRAEFDAEVLERLRKYFQNQINNLDATEMAEGPFEDPDEENFGDTWEEAAARIDHHGGLKIRFEFGKPEDD